MDQDYDLLLFELDGTAWNLVKASTNLQNGSEGQNPSENIAYTSTGGNYGVAIHNYSSRGDADFELYSFNNNFIEYNIESSSLLIPADDSDVMAVGATYWSGDPLESFSSRGPTNDGRIKPDVTAPDGVTNSVYTAGFYGTSASAPHVAGAAALLLDANSSLSHTELQYYLESTAKDLEVLGKDNLTGSGRIDVYAAYQAILYQALPIHNLNTVENFETIQDAIDASNTASGDIITVDPGTYNENVVVNKQLTIRSTSKNPVDTIVQASDSNDHVFNIAADYVNITGFTVENATGSNMAGIYLGIGTDHCNISENNVTNNGLGIYLLSSSSNTLKNNTVNSNSYNGIDVSFSSNNILENNTAFSNYFGIVLMYSSNNILINNTAFNNNYGIGLDSSNNNNITNSTLNANIWNGVHLHDSSKNNITCNFVSHNNEHGFYLKKGSIKNNISCNNIIVNGNYNFYNNQSDDVNATGNWWGTNDDDIIDIGIYDWNDDGTLGKVRFLPKLDSPAPCAPIPELAPVTLFLIGLIVLLGYGGMIQKKD